MNKEDLNRETEQEVFFYTPPYYPLDNFSPNIIELWGMVFPTAEHAYQWKKYHESAPDVAEKILEARSPWAVKEISDAHRDSVAPGFWDTNVEIMEEILTAKLAQHPSVRKKLEKTNNREIVENSPTDDFWGIGSEGSGENQLGKLWMKIREESL